MKREFGIVGVMSYLSDGEDYGIFHNKLIIMGMTNCVIHD